MFGFSRKKIQESLTRTRNSVFGQITSLFSGGSIDEDLWDDLEALLIQADVGVETTLGLIENVQERVKQERVSNPAQVQTILKEELVKLVAGFGPSPVDKKRILTVILVVGVNGSGKTTTIAKLAKYYRGHGQKVMLAAGDTFRAAAVEQLQAWGERNGVAVIAQER